MSHEPSASPSETVKASRAETSLDYRLLLLFIVSLGVMRNWDLPLVHRKLQVSDLLFLVLAATFVLRHGLKGLRPLPARSWMVLAFPLGLIPSFLETNAFSASTLQFVGFLYLVAIYWLIHLLVDSEARWWGVVRIWWWAALVVIGLAWAGWLTHHLFGRANPFLITYSGPYGSTIPFLAERVRSTFHHPAMLAAYLNASLAPLFLYAHHRRWSKASTGALISGVVLTALMTKTRVAAGVVLTAVLIWQWCVPGTGRRSRTILGGAAAGLAALAVITCFWWLLPLRPATSLGGLPLAPNSDKTPYYYFHSAALRIGRDHPWTGVGLEQYNSNMVSYIDWEQARSGFRWTDPELENQFRQSMDPHSTYFGYWSEAGLPGVLGLGIFLGWLLWSFWRASKGRSLKIPSVFFAVLLGFALNAYFLDIMTIRIFWAAMALGTVALHQGLLISR